MKPSLLFTLISSGLLISATPAQAAPCPNCPKWWTFPHVWIANSGENTVSKIEITSGCELGRYRTGPDGEDPSRIAVDRYGDAWILNRTSSTAVKIAASPYDRDNDGPITTSQDTSRNCVIEPGEVLPWNVGFPPQDEAILMRIPVDSGPRAVAVDRYNNVWIGGSGGNMGYYSGKTGQRFKVINIGRTLYNALIDKKGRLWITNVGYNSLTRIDNPDTTHTVYIIPTPNGSYAYGIAADLSGYIYVSGWSSNVLSRCKPTAASCNWSWNGPTSVATGTNARGVAVDFFGDIWVASSGTSAVYRHNAATGQIVKTISVGAEPTGVATAADGRIWVTNRSNSNVMRINPRTEQVDLIHSPHSWPYGIGDYTGIIYNSITLPALPIHPIYGRIMSTPPVITEMGDEVTVTQEGSGFIEIPRDPSEEIPPILPLPEGVEDPEASYFN